MMLRILLIPRQHTSKRAGQCSGFNALRWVLEEMGRQGKAVTTVRLQAGIEVDGLPTDEVNMRYVFGRTEYRHSIRAETIETDDDLVQMFHSRKVTADVVLTDHCFTPPYHHTIQYEIPFRMNIPENVPMVVYFDETTWPHHGTIYFRQPAAVPTLAVCSLLGGLWFISEFCKEHFLKKARPYFSATFIRKIIEEGKVLTPTLDTKGTDFDEIYAKNMARRQNREEVLIFQAASVPPNRRYDVLLRSVEKAKILGDKRLKIRFCTPRHELPEYIKGEFVDMRLNTTRDDLVATLHESDLIYEGNFFMGTALFLWESVLAGSLPVMYRDSKTADWMKGRIPKDYPYFAKNEEELTALWLWLSEHIDDPEVTAVREKLRATVKREVDQEKKAELWADSFGDVLRRSTDFKKYRNGMWGKMVLAAREHFLDPLTSAEVGELVSSFADKPNMNPHKLLSPVAFRRLLQSTGFMDVGTPDEEVWDRGWEFWVPEGLRE